MEQHTGVVHALLWQKFIGCLNNCTHTFIFVHLIVLRQYSKDFFFCKIYIGNRGWLASGLAGGIRRAVVYCVAAQTEA